MIGRTGETCFGRQASDAARPRTRREHDSIRIDVQSVAEHEMRDAIAGDTNFADRLVLMDHDASRFSRNAERRTTLRLST